MRTVHRNAPIIIGAGALALLLVASASLSLFAEEPAYTGSVVIDTESAEGAKQPAAFAELRARLDGTDRAAALNALQVAITELGDGATLIWKRPSRELTGVIKPVSAFRDGEVEAGERRLRVLETELHRARPEGGRLSREVAALAAACHARLNGVATRSAMN